MELKAAVSPETLVELTMIRKRFQDLVLNYYAPKGLWAWLTVSKAERTHRWERSKLIDLESVLYYIERLKVVQTATDLDRVPVEFCEKFQVSIQNCSPVDVVLHLDLMVALLRLMSSHDAILNNLKHNGYVKLREAVTTSLDKN